MVARARARARTLARAASSPPLASPRPASPRRRARDGVAKVIIVITVPFRNFC